MRAGMTMMSGIFTTVLRIWPTRRNAKTLLSVKYKPGALVHQQKNPGFVAQDRTATTAQVTRTEEINTFKQLKNLILAG
jgi:hypothetical protein